MASNTCPELMELAIPEQLEMRYGGTAPDKNDKFWPATMPTNEYGVDKSLIEKEPQDNMRFIISEGAGKKIFDEHINSD